MLGKGGQGGFFFALDERSAVSWEWWLMAWGNLDVPVKLGSLTVCAC